MSVERAEIAEAAAKLAGQLVEFERIARCDRGMTNKLKTKHLTVRLEDELAEAIEAEAARERRTTANMIRNLLSDALAARRSDEQAAA